MDDKECVRRCLGGDQAAVRVFVERFHGPLYTVCLRRLRNREDAEDVAQVSLIRAIRYLHRWDSKRSLRPWVLKIGVNCCLSHLQERNRRITTVNTTIEPSAKQDQHRTIELSEVLQIALDKIRDRHRTCFILFYLQELSIVQIAEIMGCPEGSVKTWLHRARLDLGRLLANQGFASNGGCKDGYELQ